MSAELGTPAPTETRLGEFRSPVVASVATELTPSKETRRVALREPYVGLAICGKHGVGKSDIAELLLASLEARRFSGGEKFRAQKGGDKSTVGYMHRDVEVDRQLDQEQIEFFGDLTTENPGLDESNLSHFLATEFMQDNPQAKIVRILITCKRDIAARRIRDRALEKWDTKQAQNDAFLWNGFLSEEEHEERAQVLEAEKRKLHTDRVARDEQMREKRDVVQFNIAHPELDGINPYEQEAIWRGQKLFDKAVSTSHKTQAEAVNEILDWMVQNGIADEITVDQSDNQTVKPEMTVTQPAVA